MNSRPGPGDTPAGSLVHDRLRELVDRIAIHESRIRHQEPEGVHRMRVTLRRLRSLLATFGPMFDTDTVTGLRSELRWISGEMGAARDTEVVRKRLSTLARSAEQRAVVGRIVAELDAAETAGLDGLLATLDSDRFGRALHHLNAFVADPPWDEAAGLPTEDTLRDLVHRDWRRLRRRAHRARQVIDPDQRQAALHDVRKAAKRLRYSAEAMVPLHRREATRLVALTKRVQTKLGELQDSVVTREVLQTSADRGTWDDGELFALGGLHGREQRRAARAEDRYAQAWDRLVRKKYRRWLT